MINDDDETYSFVQYAVHTLLAHNVPHVSA